MTAPLIGITTSRTTSNGAIPLVGVSESYIQAIQNARGIPLLIPLDLDDDQLDSLFDRLDGVLFPGGGDIDPQIFHGQPHTRVYGIEPDRDRVELHLARRAAESFR